MFGATIRRLEIFCAVIETGSATRAAAALGMSQPAVSQQVARLEAELGLVLFARENGRLRPTEMALAFYDETRTAFDGMDRVLRIARDMGRQDRGLLRVAAPHSAGTTILPRALRRLASDRPRLRFAITFGSYATINAMVSAREIDLALSKLPVPAGVETVPVLDTGLVAIASPAYPLGGTGAVSPRQLAEMPLVMIGRGRPWRDEIDLAFRRQGIAPRVAVETQSVGSAVALVEQGFGTAVVPEWLAVATGTDCLVRPLDLPVRHSFVVLYPIRTAMSGLAEEFADILKCVRIRRQPRPNG